MIQVATVVWRTELEDESMSSVPIEEAQSKLTELIEHLKAGDEVVITKNDRPVARLISTSEPPRSVRRLGTLRGSVTYMAPDFDAPLDEFREYMP